MPTLLTTDAAICTDDPPWSPDEAQVAAATFLARDSGRTLEAYRHDLRYWVFGIADMATIESKPATIAARPGMSWSCSKSNL